MKRTNIAIVSLLLTSVLAAAGCEKKAPPAAKAALVKALDALKAKNQAGFLALVIPSQRKSFTLEKPLMMGQHSLKTVPTAVFLSTKLFSTMTDYSIKKETLDDDGKAVFLTTMQAAGGYTFGTYFKMAKKDGEWMLDLKATVDWEIKRNGSHAFSGTKLVK